ncbi:MAG: hypothetical protein WC175_03080 [Candidatus Dojkabacteria bacterium]
MKNFFDSIFTVVFGFFVNLWLMVKNFPKGFLRMFKENVTNAREHLLGGIIIGFIGAIFLGIVNMPRSWVWCVFFIMNFFYIMIIREFYQAYKSGKPLKAYFTEQKRIDTIFDVVISTFGFILFFLPLFMSILR